MGKAPNLEKPEISKCNETTSVIGQIVYRVGCTAIGIYHDKWKIVKETQKGYWIEWVTDGFFISINAKPKWMSKTAKNRFARFTKKEALEDYIIRQSYRKKCIQAKLNECQEMINRAKTELEIME